MVRPVAQGIVTLPYSRGNPGTFGSRNYGRLYSLTTASFLYLITEATVRLLKGEAGFTVLPLNTRSNSNKRKEQRGQG